MKYKIRTAVPTDEGKIRELMSDSFEHDYNDLSDRTKEAFLDRYNTIKSVVLGDMQESKTSQY
jgi:hypothetical protein